jgi:hypothetical protein
VGDGGDGAADGWAAEAEGCAGGATDAAALAEAAPASGFDDVSLERSQAGRRKGTPAIPASATPQTSVLERIRPTAYPRVARTWETNFAFA